MRAPNSLIACVGLFALVLGGAWPCPGAAQKKSGKKPGKPGITLKMSGPGIDILIDGKLFTTYLFDVMGTPVFYPIVGPGGVNLTRHYPMEKGFEGEDEDHIHHRSIWFGHRNVNDESFWGALDKDGVTKHQGVKRMEAGEDGSPAVIVVENKMVTPGGEVMYSDEREYRVHSLGDGEVRLDYIVTIKADQGVDLKFGNQKDGLMAVRVAPWMKLADRKGNLMGGSIVNSAGVTDRDAWGKRADWVDYYGTAPGGGVCGIAMFDHPENLRHPTWWHARTYGLLSANPFGQGDFEKGKVPKEAGDYTLEKGKELKFIYGFYFHRGDTKAAEVAKHYEQFAAGK